MSRTFFVVIGNSDDKLEQWKWSRFIREVFTSIKDVAITIYGEWYSLPDSEYQNACIAFDVDDSNLKELRYELRDWCDDYDQDSIAFTEGQTEFIKPI